MASTKNVLIESVLSAGTFELIDHMAMHNPYSGKKALLSFGASALSGSATDIALPYLSSMGKTTILAEKTYVKPIMSGALYVLGDKLFHVDSRGLLMPFLLQVGSQVAGSYAATPLEAWINKK